MRKTIFGCLGVAAVAFALQLTPANVQAAFFSACDPCNPCNEVDFCNPCDDALNCDPCDAVCGPSLGKWFINGHMEAGFFANAHGHKSSYDQGTSRFGRGADFMSGNSDALMNTRLTGAQINQVYLSMGKRVDGRHGLDIGGTVDFTWGSDAYMVQAAGLERTAKDPTGWGTGDYFAAFAQAYAEAEYGRWNFKAGKFFAPFGSSGYKSTDNFFYSWAPTAMISPHTGGGAYATYKVSDKLSVMGGWVMPEEIGHCEDNNFVLGGIVWTPSNRLNLRYAFAAGDECGFLTEAIGGTPGDRVFVHSLVTTSQLSRRLKYVFDWTLLDAEHFNAYGLNNEFIYQANKKWAFGTRFGMLHTNTFAAQIFGGEDYGIESGFEMYTVAIGANWTPNKWLTVKPELRYDWTDRPVTRIFASGAQDHQVSGGLSAVVKF